MLRPEDVEKAALALAKECGNVYDYSMRVVTPFLEGKYDKDLMVILLRCGGVDTSRIDGMSDEECRRAMKEAQATHGESGREATAERNNEAATGGSGSGSESEKEEADRLFGLSK